MTKQLTLNCDMGESFGPWEMGDDKAIMPLIDAANIACGGHAGDPSTMRRCIELGRGHKTEIGAHVPYPERRGLGRGEMDPGGQGRVDLIQNQFGALDGIARAPSGGVPFVRPHGALYPAMLAAPAVMNDIMRAVSRWHSDLELVVLATPRDRKTLQLAVEHGLTLRYEAFADRGYTSRGLLLGRDKPGALLSPSEAAKQAVAISQNKLRTGRGKRIPVNADTLCVHSDTPGATKMIKAIRQALDGL